MRILGIKFFLFLLVGAGYTAESVDSLVVTFSNPSRPGTVKADMMMGGIKVRIHSGKDVIILSKESDETPRIVLPEMNFDMDVFVDDNFENAKLKKEPDPEKTKGLQKIQSSQFGINVEEHDNIIEINMPPMAKINPGLLRPIRKINMHGATVADLKKEILNEY